MNKVVPEIEKLAIRGTYTGNKDGKPSKSEFNFSDEWLVHLKTFDQDPKTFKSAVIGMAIS